MPYYLIPAVVSLSVALVASVPANQPVATELTALKEAVAAADRSGVNVDLIKTELATLERALLNLKKGETARPQLLALCAAVDQAAKKGENVNQIAVELAALEKHFVPQPGEECDFEVAPGVKVRFCWVPKGRATLGSPDTEKGHDKDTEKEHDFETPGFWMGKYEVTMGEYEAVLGTFPNIERYGKPAAGRFARHNKDWSRYPVENILSPSVFIRECEVLRHVLRLPTPDEWEYACRGGLGNKRPYYIGEELRPALANYFAGEDRRPTPVGFYEKAAPHPWGLCDMIGNLREWCYDAKNGDTLCGGSYKSKPIGCRAAAREQPTNPNLSYKIGNLNDCGFRLLLEPTK